MKNEYLIHYGILGMKWGVRKNNKMLAKKARSDYNRYAQREALDYRQQKKYTELSDFQQKKLKKLEIKARTATKLANQKLSKQTVRSLDKNGYALALQTRGEEAVMKAITIGIGTAILSAPFLPLIVKVIKK